MAYKRPAEKRDEDIGLLDPASARLRASKRKSQHMVSL